MASAWVHDYAPRIRCMVLAAPAFVVKLYVPFARSHLLGQVNRATKPDLHVKYLCKAFGPLTHEQGAYGSPTASDPLIHPPDFGPGAARALFHRSPS